MKKITVGLLLLVATADSVFAQDYKKVRTAFTIFMTLGADAKLEEAKAEVDKLAIDPKAQGKAETYMLKAEIYGSITNSNVLKAKYPNATNEGYYAFEKYLELEPGAEKLKEDNYLGIGSIYNSIFSEGQNFYKLKNWDSAYISFQNLLKVSEFLIEKKITSTTFDTLGNLYAGVTAQNAGKQAEAGKYYKRLADIKLSGPDYESIYDFLTKYYLRIKSNADFDKYIDLAKQLYPKNQLWTALQFEYIAVNSSPEEVLKKYDQDALANRLTSEDAMDYGNFFFNDKKVRDLKPEEKKPFTQKATEAFTKAAELDPANVLAAYNVAVSYYVQWEEAADAASAIKGITPEIKSRRAQADKVAIAASDKAIAALENAYKKLDEKTAKSKIEMNSTTTSAKFLAALYGWRRDKAKGKAAEYDMYDKKMLFYDKKY